MVDFAAYNTRQRARHPEARRRRRISSHATFAFRDPSLSSRLRMTRRRASFPVFVEAPPALSSEPSRVHHLHEQRTRPVFRIAESLFQHAQDGEADIETDEVGECERA